MEVGSNALKCATDDASSFLVNRLGPKPSEYEKNVIAMSTVTGSECHHDKWNFVWSHDLNQRECVGATVASACWQVCTVRE